MNYRKSLLSLVVCGFSALALVGCGGDDDDTGNGGGTGGGSGQPAANEIPVTWSATGWIDLTDVGNELLQIQGPWYNYDDCMDAEAQSLSCTEWDPALTGPDEAASPGWTIKEDGSVCLKGTATKVDSVDTFSYQWGAGAALDLASSGGADAVKGEYDATAKGVVGFKFDITPGIGATPLPTKIRMNFPIAAAGVDAHFVDVTTASGVAEAQWGADTPKTSPKYPKQGSWVAMNGGTPVDFDPSAIQSIQFQVFTATASATPFDFCIKNMRAIMAEPVTAQ